MENDISKISNFLETVEKPVLDEYRRGVVRAKVMKVAKRDEKVICFVKNASRAAVLPLSRKAVIKEMIMGEIAAQKRSIFGGFAVLFRRAVSACLIFMMCFGLFGFLNVSTRIAMAGTFTSVENFRGEVFVERGGEKLAVSGDMKLFEGDVVSTSDNGWVSIKFLDDSVVRLKEGSEVSIKKLFRSDENFAVTNVEVEIGKGDMWSRVLNLFEDGSDFSVTAGEMVASAKKAAFSVHRDGEHSSVEVYSNVVNFGEKKISSGQKAVKTADSAIPKVVDMPATSVKNSWVQSNLESDVAHIAKVEEKKTEDLKNAVGALPGSALYPVKSLRADVTRLLTFDDVSKAKVELETAERKFVEWTVLLKGGNAKEADVQKVFDKFIKEAEEFKGVVADVRASGDDKYADELKNYLKNKIGERKKDLSTILPASPMYAAKNVVFEAEVASAETDVEKTLIMQAQASQKLSEAQDLKQAGEAELSTQAVESYVEASKAVQEEVMALPEEEKVQVESVVADAVKEGNEVISALDTLPVAGDMSVVDVPKSKKPLRVYNPVPVQNTSQFGVPVAGSGDDEKPLDPMFDFGR